MIIFRHFIRVVFHNKDHSISTLSLLASRMSSTALENNIPVEFLQPLWNYQKIVISSAILILGCICFEMAAILDTILIFQYSE